MNDTPARPLMSRYRAFAIHLLSSVVVGVIVFLLVWKLWYPGALFELSGGRELASMVIGIDVIVGPLLTLVVFNAAKKSIRFDMAVIVLLQLGALVYGMYVVSVARPVLLVVVVDVVKVVTANDLAEVSTDKLDPSLRPGWTGPKLIGAERVSAPGQGLTDEDFALFESGRDIEMVPEQYRPYESVRGTLRDRAIPAGNEDLRRAEASSILYWAEPAPAPGQCVVPVLAKRGEGRLWVDCTSGKALSLSE